ncbi:DUF460 domain-containing protein [Candidatus Woesearchaeota archaeon]|nr:DUF460 domain-containing protein [Candidatus Woesearchaeota archaeon]
MENKKLLIVGIDPGTTIGYAVLDIEGNLIYLHSSKQLDLNSLIAKTVELGKAVLVGTDKLKVPGLVQAFATKLGARIVSPEQDLKVDEKRSIVKNFKCEDEHQSDALASALFTFKESRQLLDKIDAFASDNKKHSIKNKIKELVITKRISIKNAAGIIEKREEDKIMEKFIVEKKLNEDDFSRLHNKLKRFENEIGLIKNYNNKLKKSIAYLEKRQNKNEEQKTGKRTEDFRENRIKFLEFALKSKEKAIEELGLAIKNYCKIISNINNFYILKKLDNLGINEFNFKNKIINIQRNDLLLVDDPNIISEGVIDFLKNRAFVIVHKKQISKKNESNMPFVFISAKNLKIEEEVYFGFVERKQFEIEKDKVNWVKKVIEDYKREKEQLIR